VVSGRDVVIGAVDEKCPVCNQSMKYVGKSSDATAHGHHARKFYCKNCDMYRLGGWSRD